MHLIEFYSVIKRLLTNKIKNIGQNGYVIMRECTCLIVVSNLTIRIRDFTILRIFYRDKIYYFQNQDNPQHQSEEKKNLEELELCGNHSVCHIILTVFLDNYF